MNCTTAKRVTGLLLAGCLLSACTSHIPPQIRQAPAGNPDLPQVLDNPSEYLTHQVRWGGTLLATENRADSTWLTVLAIPLGKDGKPETWKVSTGRFIAIVPGFLEPVVYKSDRQITVTGNVSRMETRKVGEYPYRHPVIEVESHYVWPVQQLRYEDGGDPYWWHDPWYDPYFPYRHYPFWHPYYY